MLETQSDLIFRVRVRLAVLKYFAAVEGSSEILDDVELIEYYIRRKELSKAMEVAENAMLRNEKLKEAAETIHGTEGVYH